MGQSGLVEEACGNSSRSGKDSRGGGSSGSCGGSSCCGWVLNVGVVQGLSLEERGKAGVGNEGGGGGGGGRRRIG